MMTTIQVQHNSYFGSSATEDPMELTSDMDHGRQNGEDIDIDLDLTDEVVEQDDSMVEDSNTIADQEQASYQDFHTSNDDEMVDDGYLEGSVVDRYPIHDEDLEDADSVNPGEFEEPFDHAIEDGLSEPYPERTGDEQQTDAKQPEDQEYQEQCTDMDGKLQDQISNMQSNMLENDWVTPNQTLVGKTGALNHSQYDPTNDADNALNEDDAIVDGNDTQTSSVDPNASSAIVQQSQTTARDEKVTGEGSHIPSTADVTSSAAPEQYAFAPESRPEEASHGQSSLGDTEYQLPNSSTALEETEADQSAYVHPVVVIYQDNEISLFPPKNDEEQSSTYFLEDEQLAGESLTKLLDACRSVLGASIGAQDELNIDIDDLGLHVREFAPESSKTTLIDLLDIYVHLQQHDGHEDPPPLFMQLTTTPRFSHRLEYLMNAIAEKKGLSQLQPSGGNEEPLQPDSEPVLNPNELEPRDAPLSLDVKTSQYSQDDDDQDTPDESTSRPVAFGPEGRMIQAVDESPRQEAKSSETVVPSEVDFTNMRSETAYNDDVSPQEQKNDDHARETGETTVVSSLLQTHSKKPLEQPEPSIDNVDFLDYEEEESEGQGHGTSSGSSTLQDDALDPTLEEPIVTAEDGPKIDNVDESEVLASAKLASGLEADSSAYVVDASTFDEQDGQDVESDLDFSETLDEIHYEDENDERIDGDANSNELDKSDDKEDDDASSAQVSDDARGKSVMEPSGQEIAPQLEVEQITNAHRDLTSSVFDTGSPKVTQRKGVNTAKLEKTDHMSINSAQQSYDTDAIHDIQPLNPSHTVMSPKGDETDAPVPKDVELQPQTPAPGDAQYREDDDEITYEDDVSKEESSELLLQTESSTVINVDSSLLKRARSPHDEDDFLEAGPQDVKRVRSG